MFPTTQGLFSTAQIVYVSYHSRFVSYRSKCVCFLPLKVSLCNLCLLSLRVSLHSLYFPPLKMAFYSLLFLIKFSLHRLYLLPFLNFLHGLCFPTVQNLSTIMEINSTRLDRYNYKDYFCQETRHDYESCSYQVPKTCQYGYEQYFYEFQKHYRFYSLLLTHY